jgi:hypothetical protein
VRSLCGSGPDMERTEARAAPSDRNLGTASLPIARAAFRTRTSPIRRLGHTAGVDVDGSLRNATLDAEGGRGERGGLPFRHPHAVAKDAAIRAASSSRADVLHAVAAALVKATLESSAVIQGGERPVGEQDENDDTGQRDEVRIATPAIILLTIIGRARIHAISSIGLRPAQDCEAMNWLAARIAM